MTISIENKEHSGMALLEPTGGDPSSVLRPFCFPSENVSIPAGKRINLIKVPVPESVEGSSLISTEGAREAIPIHEAMGKNLDAYTIESFQNGEGGRVNGVKLEPGSPIDDSGISFVAS